MAYKPNEVQSLNFVKAQIPWTVIAIYTAQVSNLFVSCLFLPFESLLSITSKILQGKAMNWSFASFHAMLKAHHSKSFKGGIAF
jgi:hypothetical protein